jgi:phage terminase large subunit GpA-like protein
MSQDIKQILREEYIKCATNPVYFMKKYCYIQHPQRGRIQFQLFPFQEKVLKLFQENPYSVVLKSRQLGLSTLSSGYALWLMIFYENKNILALATTQATARNLVSKVQFMYENLPSWLKIGHEENNKLSLKLKNGSKIQAKSSSPDAARSEAVSLLIVDEAAFIENIAETWTSAQQTLATGGGAIILSTPYGTGNWFHQMWESAENSLDSEFLPIKLPWYVHPERDQTWRDKQDIYLEILD